MKVTSLAIDNDLDVIFSCGWDKTVMVHSIGVLRPISVF